MGLQCPLQRAALHPSISLACLRFSTGHPFSNISTKYNLVTPLESLSVYKRLYAPLLGIFTKITFIDSKKFPVHCFHTVLRYPANSPCVLSLSILTNLIPPAFIPTKPQSSQKKKSFYFAFPGRSMYTTITQIVLFFT